MSSVDVVIPCYNYAHFLPFAVESALGQRDVDVRVLILDDQSPDNTPEVGARLAAQDTRVTYRRNEKNLGLIGTANAGIAWVESDYYVLLSADDALTPGALARAVEVLDANPEVHLVYGRALIIGDEAPARVADVGNARYQLISSLRFLRRNVDHGNPVPSPTALIRSEAQRRIGLYNPELKHTSDMEMWMRFAAYGPVAAIQDLQAYYRVHNVSMSTAFLHRALRDRQEVLDTLAEVFGKWTAHLPQTQGWYEEVRARFRHEAYWVAGKAFEDGNENGMSERLAFARSLDDAPWLSADAWKLRLMRLMGRSLWNSMRKARGRALGDRSTETENVFAPSQEFGWWPERAG